MEGIETILVRVLKRIADNTPELTKAICDLTKELKRANDHYEDDNELSNYSNRKNGRSTENRRVIKEDNFSRN